MSKRTTPEKKDPPVNGVLVQLAPGEQEGALVLNISALGEVKQTEIPTLLGLAKKTAEQQLGI